MVAVPPRLMLLATCVTVRPSSKLVLWPRAMAPVPAAVLLYSPSLPAETVVPPL